MIADHEQCAVGVERRSGIIAMIRVCHRSAPRPVRRLCMLHKTVAFQCRIFRSRANMKHEPLFRDRVTDCGRVVALRFQHVPNTRERAARVVRHRVGTSRVVPPRCQTSRDFGDKEMILPVLLAFQRVPTL